MLDPSVSGRDIHGMKIFRSVGAVILGYALVVLITEFGFRLFPGGRAPKHAGVAMSALATLIAVAAGFTGGYVAAVIADARATFVVALPLIAESIWLLTTRTPRDEFAGDLFGACVLIGSVIAAGLYKRSRQLRSSAAPSS